jgi:hypothetical protein
VSRPFDVKLPLEQSLVRRGLFALELLDPVTLSRVSQGVTVKAEGLRGKPTVNVGGLFVWLQEDLTPLRRVSIDPGTLPYDQAELTPGQMRLPPLTPPITTVELSPRVSYPFTAGITGFRGTLIEERDRPVPIAEATVRLRWLDDDGTTWRDAPSTSRTDVNGDFAALLRFSAQDVPQVSAGGFLTVRLQATRGGAVRESAALPLLQGRVTDPTTSNPLTFAWDELQP